MDDYEDEFEPPTYTHCHICKKLWNPNYGSLDIKDDVVPAIIIYTCINCLSKKKK